MTNNAIFSTLVRAGRSSYFIDVREAKNGSKFLCISESRIDAEDKRQKSVIRVFGDSIQPFAQAVSEASASIKE